MTDANADSDASAWGRCTICGWTGRFIQSARPIRESFGCGDCKSSLRYRAQADAILGAFKHRYVSIVQLANTDEWSSLRIFEPGILGPFRRFFQGRENYLNSVYWPGVASGAVRDGMLCQDLMNLTIDAKSFDIVITSDILGHVRKPMQAFREIRRVLKTGGRHIFSVPAQEPMRAKTISRVDTSKERDVYILPEVYHGSGNGGRSLVYTEFGIDILDKLADIGFPTQCCWYEAEDGGIPRVATFVSTRIG